MSNFIWQLIQGREFTTNYSFYFLFLLPFHPFNHGRSQSTSTLVGWFINKRTLWPNMLQYVCVQREMAPNSGKEISAPQIIQGREFTTRSSKTGYIPTQQGYYRFTSNYLCKRIHNFSFPSFIPFFVHPRFRFPSLSLWFLFPVSGRWSGSNGRFVKMRRQ